MKPRIPRRSACLAVSLALTLAPAVLGCKAEALSGSGIKVYVLYDEPIGCENLGIVTGYGGGLSGAYAKPSINEESAENDARNKAGELGATHLLLHPEQVSQGDGRGPVYTDPDPTMEMAHGSGTGSTVSLPGTAYRCKTPTPQTKTEASLRGGSTFVAVAAPTAISLAPLGPLERIAVFHRAPSPTGRGVDETELLVVEDRAKIEEVEGSLSRVVLDPMKYIPTHRVELVGELGVQSLLYGFGYLQYAGEVYRLTDGVFEEVLQLREVPKSPDVETESPAEPESAEDSAPADPASP